MLAHGLREPGRPWTHCMRPVTWVGRWKFLEGWTKVWSCEQHADKLVGARRLRFGIFRTTGNGARQSRVNLWISWLEGCAGTRGIRAVGPTPNHLGCGGVK